jgi:hypothetical protein
MAMEMRAFGRTGMRLTVLGFGCGAGGGLMVRGDALDQERTIARAIAAGVNYLIPRSSTVTVNLKRPRPRPTRPQGLRRGRRY